MGECILNGRSNAGDAVVTGSFAMNGEWYVDVNLGFCPTVVIVYEAGNNSTFGDGYSTNSQRAVVLTHEYISPPNSTTAEIHTYIKDDGFHFAVGSSHRQKTFYYAAWK